MCDENQTRDNFLAGYISLVPHIYLLHFTRFLVQKNSVIDAVPRSAQLCPEFQHNLIPKFFRFVIDILMDWVRLQIGLRCVKDEW